MEIGAILLDTGEHLKLEVYTRVGSGHASQWKSLSHFRNSLGYLEYRNMYCEDIRDLRDSC